MVLSANFRIGLTLLNKENELSNKGILAIFEDTAEMHSASVGYGVTDIAKTNLSWALLNWKVRIYRRAKHGEHVTVKTWTRPSNKIHFFRDFELYDSNGNIIAIGSSKWVLIDVFTHKITKLTDEIEAKYQPEDRTVFDDEESIALPKLKEIDDYSVSLFYKIRRADIDINEHVNNLCYLDIAKEILPERISGTLEGNEFEIMFRYQIKFEDDITVYYGMEDNTHYVVVKSHNDECLHSVMKFK